MAEKAGSSLFWRESCCSIVSRIHLADLRPSSTMKCVPSSSSGSMMFSLNDQSIIDKYVSLLIISRSTLREIDNFKLNLER